MSKRLKLIIAAVIVAILAPILVYGPILLMFQYSDLWGNKVKDFPEYQHDFVQVADFCSEYIREETQTDPNANNWLWYDVDCLSYTSNRTTKDLTLDVTLQQSVEKIRNAFPTQNAALVRIYCYDDGSVYFITDGYYSLAYCPNGKPTSLNGDDKGEPCLYKKIVDNWYHVVPKPKWK